MSGTNLNKIIIASSSIVLIIIIALFISFGINKSSITKLENEAKEYIKDEDYQSASGIYTKLISKTGEKKYKDKKTETDLMVRDSKQFKIGVEKIENEDYINGIRYFKNMDENDKYFLDKAKQELKKSEDGIIKVAKTAIDEDNTYLASTILNDYVSIVGKSEKAEELLKTLDEPSTETEEETDNTSQEVTAELPENTDDWVGKTFEVKGGKANIRENPDLDGKVLTTIAAGGTITIEKTEDDGERVWCYGTVVSAKTGETFKAWISSKNLQ